MLRQVGFAFVLGLGGLGAFACASAPSSQGSKDPSCPSENPECKELATVEAGEEAVVKRRCVQCHGRDLGGSETMLPNIPKTLQGDAVELYPPNITSDETGVGGWSDDALALAIRAGIDDDSQALCPQMKHFSEMTDFEAYSIVKYLRDIPKVSKRVPRSVCPPTKTKEQQSLED